MKLANVMYEGRVRAAVVDRDELALLETEDLRAAIALSMSTQELPVAATVPLDAAELLAPITPISKFFCIGLNYYSHMAETGLPKPEYPIIFSKFPSVLIGPIDDVLLPNTSHMIDWEVELGVVIGKRIREGDEEAAASAIGGYTVVNDVSARDLQLHTSQWLPGKNLESSTPVGPWIVTVDELGPNPDLEISTRVDGVVRQSGRTTDQIFAPAQLIAYISSFITLEPGDIIATGTCDGVGHIMTPPVYLAADQLLETYVENVGALSNRCVAGRVAVSGAV